MRVRFHGVRGSIPTADLRTWRYGGNTACVEVETPAGHRIILDGGTGLRRLSLELSAEGRPGPIRAALLLSHYHWDHIQGLPFFAPLYDPRNRFDFFGLAPEGGQGMEAALRGQMTRPYFPVPLSLLAAARAFRAVGTGDRWPIQDAEVEAIRLHHPQGCLGFRIETERGVVVYASDTEPGNPEGDAAVRHLARQADVLIYDAQFSPAMLEQRRGWGHSSWLEGTRVAREAAARTLILFHHDPDADDGRVDGLVRQARREWPETWAAAEGLQVTCRRPAIRLESTVPRIAPRLGLQLPIRLRGQRPDGTPLDLEAVLTNFTLKGGLVVAPESPDPDALVEIALVDADGGPAVTGQVVRMAIDPETGLPALGIAFTPEAAGSRSSPPPEPSSPA